MFTLALAPLLAGGLVQLLIVCVVLAIIIVLVQRYIPDPAKLIITCAVILVLCIMLLRFAGIV
jgi:uncharacterized membrane protein YccC